METNRFMLECTSICPKTTHQKLEPQRVNLTLLTMNLFVCVDTCTYIFQHKMKGSEESQFEYCW